jgi:hypothetical protein
MIIFEHSLMIITHLRLYKQTKSFFIGKFFRYIRVLQPNIRHDTQLVDLIEVERLNNDNNN